MIRLWNNKPVSAYFTQHRWTVTDLGNRKALAYIVGNRLKDAQESTIKRYCQENNIDLHDIYCSEREDEASSTNTVTSTYNKMKDVIKERSVNTVIVSANEGIEKDFSEIKILKDLMFNNGIVFISIEEDNVWTEYQDFKINISPLNSGENWV